MTEAATEDKHELFVMDRSGHRSTFRWGQSEAEISVAREAFNSYLSRGFTMYRLTQDGEQGRIIREFDPTAPGILAVPRMVGG